MRNKIDTEIAVIIPCYNEAQTIGKVVEDFKTYVPDATIIVCDNNSDDNTSEVASKAGAIVIHESRPGKANAVLKCFERVTATYYVMIDGDDTYPASECPIMLEVSHKKELDMLIGDRLSNGTYKAENKRPFHNFGNSLIRNLINWLFKSSLNDILTGYRVFSYRFVQNYATLAKGFELETDLSLFALNYDLKIQEHPIVYKDRPEGSESKLNTFTDGIKVVITFFDLFRFYKPLLFFASIGLLILFIGLLLGSFPLYEYLKYEYVYKVPTAILAVSLVILSVLFLICGLILDTIIRADRKQMRLAIRKTHRIK